jgi:membrane-bound serine protease (ClpP class)
MSIGCSSSRHRFSFLFILIGLAFCALVWTNRLVAEQEGTVLVLEIQGVIGPALSEYIDQGLQQAKDKKSTLLVLEMDTPGGLDSSMRDIIQAILASPVPVATYVSPQGARAASAGTYILYGSHVAAMAPATNLGAATPVQIGGWPALPEKSEKPHEQDDEKEQQLSGSAMQRKILNDAEAYIRGLAKRNNRNSDWAAKAVREAVSLSASEALELGVIDLMADDLEGLLIQLDGREVEAGERNLVLATAGARVERLEKDWRLQLLGVLTNPNIAYILLLVGVYGIIFELANPGQVLPGVVGTIAILLALYTFQLLPINYAGLALILVGIVFMVAEAFAPSFGALGIGGIIAFVIGSVILLDAEYLRISYLLIGGITLFSALFFLWVLARMVALRRRPVVAGLDQMVGCMAEAMEDFSGEGRVLVQGESWLGRCEQPVKVGQKLRVKSRRKLLLELEIIMEEQ